MIKKIFSAFLIILVLVVVYSFYQKNKPSVKKIFNLPKGETDSKTIFLEINQPADNATVSRAVISLDGKTIPDGSVFVGEQELKADADGNFSTSVTLDEGLNDIYVVASDDFGNSAEKDIIVNLESIQ